jgi:hypothetical protein
MKGRKTGGRKKGAPNKTTQALKDAVLEAARLAGGGDDDGVVRYLEQQAKINPAPFMSLLGRVLPMTVAGDPDNPITTVKRIERVIVPGTAGDLADTDAEGIPTAH